MFNAVNKIIAAAALGLAVCACGYKGAQGAQGLLESARSLSEAGSYNQALDSLDSLNTRYASQTAIRRDGLLLRAQIMEKIAIDSIEIASAELAEATLALDRSSAFVEHVDGPRGLEGYYLAKGHQPAITSATAVQPRVSDDGYFKMVANVSGKRIGLGYIRMQDGADSYTTREVSAARRINVANSETATFDPEELTGFGEWLAAHPSVNKLTLSGPRGHAEVRLTPELRQQIIACYEFARDTQRLHLARVHREKFERMLATSRQQIANLTQPDEEQ